MFMIIRCHCKPNAGQQNIVPRISKLNIVTVLYATKPGL